MCVIFCTFAPDYLIFQPTKYSIRMTKRTNIALLSVLIGVATLSSCGNSKRQQTSMSATFKTMKVEKRDITLNSKYSATIRGQQDVEVYPQVSGTLKKLCVTEGERVKKGQTLFIIDQVPYIAALNTAQAQLEAAEAQLATATLNYNSTKTLREQNVVGDFDLQTAYNSKLNAEAAVSQAKAQVVNAKNSLSYTEVESPSDGVVGTLPYRQGALVSSSMAQPLTTVSDNAQMYVYFSITEAQLLQIARDYGSVDTAVEKMPAVSLTLVDGSTYGQQGKVETASGVVDQKTGAVQLRAVFDNPQGLLHSGSTGNVLMPVEYKDQIIIPTAATVQTQDKYRVYIVNSEGNAEERMVTISPHTDGKNVIVTSGLTAGEEIVAEGAGMVTDGQCVKPNQENK